MNPQANAGSSRIHAPHTALPELATPPEVTEALQKYRQQIKQAAGTALACLAVYGGVVRGRYQPQRSDINVLLVIAEASIELLQNLSPILTAAWREIRLEPFLLTRKELPRAAVLFPTKMLDIRRFHRLLDGEDLLSGLEIRQEDICLRLEQELRNLAMRLRRRFLSIEQDEQAMRQALLGVAVPLRVSLLALLELNGAEPIGEERTAAVYAEAATRFKLDGTALQKLSTLRDDGQGEGDTRSLYEAIMQVVANAAELMTEPGRRP
jgi:hypothetical protein